MYFYSSIFKKQFALKYIDNWVSEKIILLHCEVNIEIWVHTTHTCGTSAYWFLRIECILHQASVCAAPDSALWHSMPVDKTNLLIPEFTKCNKNFSAFNMFKHQCNGICAARTWPAFGPISRIWLVLYMMYQPSISHDHKAFVSGLESCYMHTTCTIW